MKQSDLNREVARATGETVSTIKRLGFLLDDPRSESLSADDGPLVIDWDEFDAVRYLRAAEGLPHVPAA